MSKWTPFGAFKPGDLRVLGLGLELAAAIGGLAWLGDWLDHRWHTGSKLLLTGIFLGMVGGCWNIYQSAKKEGLFDFKRRPKTSQKDAQQDAPATQDGTAPRSTPPSDDDFSSPS